MVENIVRKGGIACYKQFLLFSYVFHCYISLVHQNVALCSNGLTLSQTSPGFAHICSTSLLKTQLEKEKLLVTSNFSFSHFVFYPFGELCHFHQI